MTNNKTTELNPFEITQYHIPLKINNVHLGKMDDGSFAVTPASSPSEPTYWTSIASRYPSWLNMMCQLKAATNCEPMFAGEKTVHAMDNIFQLVANLIKKMSWRFNLLLTTEQAAEFVGCATKEIFLDEVKSGKWPKPLFTDTRPYRWVRSELIERTAKNSNRRTDEDEKALADKLAGLS